MENLVPKDFLEFQELLVHKGLPEVVEKQEAEDQESALLILLIHHNDYIMVG